MRSSLLTGLTTRGTSFLTAGAATVLAGLLLGSRALISVGVALIVLPMLARLAAGRARYRLSCTRSVNPVRVPAGTTATVTLRLADGSPPPTRLPAADRAHAGRGRHPLCAGHPAAVCPGRDRARRGAGAEVPAPV